MPVCARCGRYGATAEFRRSPKPGVFLCHDRDFCKTRRRMVQRIRSYGDRRLAAELTNARQGKDETRVGRVWLRLLQVEHDHRQRAAAA